MLKRQFEKYHSSCLTPGHPIPESLRVSIIQYANAEAEEVRTQLYEITDHDNKRSLKTHMKAGKLCLRTQNVKEGNLEEAEEELRRLEREMTDLELFKNLMMLEGIYVKLLGPAFRYRVGIRGLLVGFRDRSRKREIVPTLNLYMHVQNM